MGMSRWGDISFSLKNISSSYNFFPNWGMGVYCPACGALVAIISLSRAYLLKYLKEIK